MTQTAISIYVSEKRKEEIEQAVEKDNWNSIASYARSMICAGESNFAELDPRSIENDNNRNRRVPDTKLLNQLDDEYNNINDVVNDFVEDFENDLSQRLLEMATEDDSPVKTDGKGNYKINK